MSIQRNNLNSITAKRTNINLMPQYNVIIYFSKRLKITADSLEEIKSNIFYCEQFFEEIDRVDIKEIKE